jgi:transcriptional regulator
MEGDRAEPWSVEDAPGTFIDAQLRAIVGFEVLLDRLEGKWKLSQNRLPADRDGVVAQMAAGSARDKEVAVEMTRQES